MQFSLLEMFLVLILKINITLCGMGVVIEIA